MQQQHAVEAARAVRPYLSDLVGSVLAQDYDRVLAEILNQKNEADARITELTAVLSGTPALSLWAESTLADPDLRPPAVQEAEIRGVDVGVRPRPVAAKRFACPRGDFVWYRLLNGEQPPACPTHAVGLVAQALSR